MATVFDERTLSGLQGHLAIGHTRYSTHGASDWAGAQPVYRPVGRAGFALGHNGNLTNTTALAEKVGMLPGSIATDSDVVAELLAQSFPETEDLSTALQVVLPILEGAFSFVLMSSSGCSACAIRTASGPCASVGSVRPTRPRAGCSPPRRRR